MVVTLSSPILKGFVATSTTLLLWVERASQLKGNLLNNPTLANPKPIVTNTVKMYPHEVK